MYAGSIYRINQSKHQLIFVIHANSLWSCSYFVLSAFHWAADSSLDWICPKNNYCIQRKQGTCINPKWFIVACSLCRKDQGKRCCIKCHPITFTRYWHREGNWNCVEHNWWKWFDFVWGLSLSLSLSYAHGLDLYLYVFLGAILSLCMFWTQFHVLEIMAHMRTKPF